MLEVTVYLNDKPEGDNVMGGFKDRLEDREINTSPAMQYFNDYKKQQVVEEVDEQEELIPSLIGKTEREPEVDAFTQIYALDAQEPVQEVVEPEVDKPLLQKAWDILPTGGQQTVWPFIAPFVKGSAEENPILRGMTEGALHDAPQGMVDLSRDVVNALGGDFKEEDWLKIPQILESNPDSTTEGVVRGLSQFMSIFGAAGGIGKGSTIFKQMMAGGLADATFDPTGGNVATLLRELDMDNALTQFLDSKVGEDADALERLQARGKQVLEGAGIGFAIPTLIGGIKWAKNAGSPWIKEFMKDSDPALVQNTLKKFGVDLPQKDIVGFHNSPHKFDNIDPSKQQEGLMGKGHYIFLNKTAADDYPGAYKYTQEVPDDIRNRVINFGDGKDSLLVKSAFKNISEKTGIKFSDDFRPGSYFELIDEVGHDKAHALLRAEGVIGNMTDIGTTSKPEAVMMYSTDDVQLLTRNGESLIQGQTKETDPLIVQHNLSETGVDIADEIGGIPMPSMAVSKVDSPLTDFGDITLVGDKTLATPDRRNFVYSSDTYTGSQPSRFMAFTDVEKVADSVMNREDIKHFGDNYMFDLSSDYIDKEEIYKKLARIDAMAAKGYKTTDYDRYADMEKAFFKENPDESRWYFHTDYEVTPESLGEVEAVFTSSSGKNQPYTKENVLKQMEKNKAWKPATESGTLGSPTGRKRAVTAKKFTNIKQVEAAREKIIPEADFQEMAQSVQDKEFRVAEAITKLEEVDKRTSGQWGFGHDLSHEMMETVLSGKSIDSYGFSKETNQKLLELINPLKDMMTDMPTKYFEIKPRDIKQLSDFKGAIVPHYAKEAKKLLKKAGIKKIYTYGTEEERKELFKKFPELMFAKVAIPAGALTLQDSDSVVELKSNEENIKPVIVGQKPDANTVIAIANAKNPADVAYRYLGLSENTEEGAAAVKGFFENAIGNWNPDNQSNKEFAASKAWCAAFMTQVLRDSGVDTEKMVGKKDKFNQIRAAAYLKAGTAVQSGQVKPGDIMIKMHSTEDRRSLRLGVAHTGIVAKVVGDEVYFIGGNTGDKVELSSYNTIEEDVRFRRIKGVSDIPTESLPSLLQMQVGKYSRKIKDELMSLYDSAFE